MARHAKHFQILNVVVVRIFVEMMNVQVLIRAALCANSARQFKRELPHLPVFAPVCFLWFCDFFWRKEICGCIWLVNARRLYGLPLPGVRADKFLFSDFEFLSNLHFIPSKYHISKSSGGVFPFSL
jgi:hypothetical protein